MARCYLSIPAPDCKVKSLSISVDWNFYYCKRIRGELQAQTPKRRSMSSRLQLEIATAFQLKSRFKLMNSFITSSNINRVDHKGPGPPWLFYLTINPPGKGNSVIPREPLAPWASPVVPKSFNLSKNWTMLLPVQSSGDYWVEVCTVLRTLQSWLSLPMVTNPWAHLGV